MFKLRLHESRKKAFQKMMDELVKPLEKQDSTFTLSFKEFMCNFERLTTYLENFFEADYYLKLQRSTYVPLNERKTTRYYSKMMYYLLEQANNYEKKCNSSLKKMLDGDLLRACIKVKNLNTNHGDSSLFYNMYYIHLLTIARNSLVDYNNYKEKLSNCRKPGEIWYNAQKSYLSFKTATDMFHDVAMANIYKFIGEEHLKKCAGDSYNISCHNTSYYVSYIYKNMLKDFYSKNTKNIPTTKIAYDKMKQYVQNRKKLPNSYNNYIYNMEESLKESLYKYIPGGIRVKTNKLIKK